MSDTEPFFQYTNAQRDGVKRRINKLATFCGVLGGMLPDPATPYSEIFRLFDSTVKLEYPDVTREALSNAHGDWYEWLLAISAWNVHKLHQTKFVAITLPNIAQFDWATLYTQYLFQMIEHLRNEVKRSSDVQLISSNPDFVIIDLATIDPSPFTSELLTSKIANFSHNTIYELERLHRSFVGLCTFESIVGFVAAKSSFRPDRRLQIPHEGSLIKAIYVHLQTRQWVVNPRGIKYYAIGGKIGDSDIQALKTVATHSIVTVSSKPQAAVDQVFEVNKSGIAEVTFAEIFRQLAQSS